MTTPATPPTFSWTNASDDAQRHRYNLWIQMQNAERASSYGAASYAVYLLEYNAPPAPDHSGSDFRYNPTRDKIEREDLAAVYDQLFTWQQRWNLWENVEVIRWNGCWVLLVRGMGDALFGIKLPSHGRCPLIEVGGEADEYRRRHAWFVDVANSGDDGFSRNWRNHRQSIFLSHERERQQRLQAQRRR